VSLILRRSSGFPNAGCFLVRLTEKDYELRPQGGLASFRICAKESGALADAP